MMDPYQLIYKTKDINDLLEIYKNIRKLKLYINEDNKKILNFIVEKIIYHMFNLNLYCKNSYDMSILSNNDKFRIDYFSELINQLNKITDAIDIVYMNIYYVDNNYKDNNIFFHRYILKFNNIIKSYSCKDLIDLYVNIENTNSLVSFCYTNCIYDELINFIFSLNIELLEDFYKFYLLNENSLFKKIKLYYDVFCWICYYLIYIYNTFELEQLCMLYYDLSKDESFIKLFSLSIRSNLKSIIFKKIIYIMYSSKYSELILYKKYIKNDEKNYFKLCLKNYNRLIFHILMLSYFYNNAIPDILKIKTINKIKNKNFYIPIHDIKLLIYVVENIIIDKIQENSINELLMDY